MTPATGNPTIPTGTVTFALDGRPAPIATVPLAGGQASFTTSGLGAGPHTLAATFGGDGNFTSSTSAPTPLTVTATTTITGKHPGPVLVPTGSTVLLTGATVGGAVVVEPGGAIDVENSSIAGSLIAADPRALRLCASTVHGAASVTGAKGFVLIGDPGDDGCGSNTILGALGLTNNHHGLEAIDNRVTGPVSVSGNSGAGAFPSDTAPVISGNHP